MLNHSQLIIQQFRKYAFSVSVAVNIGILTASSSIPVIAQEATEVNEKILKIAEYVKQHPDFTSGTQYEKFFLINYSHNIFEYKDKPPYGTIGPEDIFIINRVRLDIKDSENKRIGRYLLETIDDIFDYISEELNEE